MIDQLAALITGDEIIRLHISAVLLGMIRIIAFISIAPIFGPAVTMPVKSSIAIALYLPMHPYMVSVTETIHINTIGEVLSLLIIVGKEVILGIMMGWLVALFFYIALSAGTIVDNQRGASMAQTADPLASAESSPLGVVLFLSVTTLFFASGGFLRFLELFYSSFTYWQPDELIPELTSRQFALFSISNLAWMMKQTVLIASPFIIIALVCDVSLGLINRFAPQLNVFILSMPIKSGVCALLIIFYYHPFLEHSAGNIDVMNNMLRQIFILLKAD
jgi:type III secretion protein T